MVAEFGEQDAAQLIERWGTGLDEAYRASHTPRLAAADIRQLEHLSPGKVEAHLYQEQGAAASDRRLRLYTDRPIGLTEVLPILLDFGVKVVDERVHRVAPSNDLVRYLLDFGLSAQDDPRLTDLLAAEGCQAVWSRRVVVGLLLRLAPALPVS